MVKLAAYPLADPRFVAVTESWMSILTFFAKFTTIPQVSILSVLEAQLGVIKITVLTYSTMLASFTQVELAY